MKTKPNSHSIFEFSQFFISLSTWLMFNLNSNLKLITEKEIPLKFLIEYLFPQTFQQFLMSLGAVLLVNLIFYLMLSLTAHCLNLTKTLDEIQKRRNEKKLSPLEMEMIVTFASLKPQSEVIAAKAKAEHRDVQTCLSFHFESKYPLTHPYDFYDLKYASRVISLLAGDFSGHDPKELKQLLISPALQERVVALIKDF